MDWIFITQLTFASFIGSFFCAMLAGTGEMRSIVATAGIQVILSVGLTIIIQDIAYRHITKDNMLAFGTALVLGTLSPKELRVYAKSIMSQIIKRIKK